MKQTLYTLMACCLLVWMAACQSEEEFTGSDTGYLRLQLGINTYAETRAYDPEQIGVQILSEDGSVVKETSDWQEWAGQQIALPAGNYTLKASSAGFDGKSGFDKPYYAGSADITVEKGKEVNQKITCTLANVKVTVNFDATIKKYFKQATVTVDDNSEDASIDPVTFVMGEHDGKSAYFPVTDLQAKLDVINQDDESYSQTQEFTGVKARDHYILNYAVGAGDGGIDITVDPSYKIYEYTFTIPSEPSTQLAEPTVNAWAKLAYVSSNVITSEEELLPEQMAFQYRVKDTDVWSKVSAVQEDETNYKATLTGLQPATTYECRMVYGEEEFASTTKEFTTEAATELYNGSFDNWSQSGETIYPDIADSAGNDTSFWNTSNPGTTQGLGAMGGALNPTTSITSPVVNGNAAQLKSAYKIIAFAAASLYTGNFVGLDGMSANMEFGKPFTDRPIALHGYYQYTPAVINHVDRVPAGVQITEDVTMDQCAIYIALAKKSFSFNNNDESSYIDYANDEDIIAYGELPSGGATSDTGENNGYTEFTIPLVYRSLTDTPTHIIVVCSASKYGDYMTGGEGSTLLVDEFSLVYDGEPTVKEQAQE